jgi:hypothetical protein
MMMKTLINKTTGGMLASVLMLAVLVSSCKKDDTQEIVYGDAKVRVVNAIPGSNPQNFFQGEAKVTTTAVGYGESSNYLTIKAGTTAISFRNSTTGAVSVADNLGVGTDVVFTAFYYANSSGAAQIAKIQDDNTAPATGKIKVRFINLGNVFTNSVAVKTTADVAVINPIAYGGVSAYVTADANVDLLTYTVGSINFTTIPGASLQAGKVYTIWLDAANVTTVQYHIIQQN